MANLYIDISIDGSILQNDKCRRQMEDCKCYRDWKREYKRAEEKAEARAEERAESISAEGKSAEDRRSASGRVYATVNIDAGKLIDELKQMQKALLDALKEEIGALCVNDAAVYEINKYGRN